MFSLFSLHLKSSHGGRDRNRVLKYVHATIYPHGVAASKHEFVAPFTTKNPFVVQQLEVGFTLSYTLNKNASKKVVAGYMY